MNEDARDETKNEELTPEQLDQVAGGLSGGGNGDNVDRTPTH